MFKESILAKSFKEEMDKENQMKKEILHDYVSKEKIKAKIEEIIKENPAQDDDWDGTDYKVTSEEDYAIEKLEELLKC